MFRGSPGFLAPILLGAVLVTASRVTTQTGFVAPPYLQLGTSFADGTLSVVWHAAPATPAAPLEWRYQGETNWRPAASVSRLDTPDRTVVEGALPVGHRGRAFEYRVGGGASTAFSSGADAPSPPGAPFAFAVLADAGDGGSAQRALAERLMVEHEAGRLQLILLAGDLVYECGLRREYARKFFPIYNATPATGGGVPLMRQVVMVAAPGNHDVGDQGVWPFANCSPDYSYFAFWKHPAGFEGPLPITPSRRPRAPAAGGFLRRDDLPRALARANFSFDWGGAHFVVLDSNRYVDWAAPPLLSWLERDLAGARGASWRFVVLHHPPFNLSRANAGDQWMRALAPVFERHGVTAVFGGHVHNFQWFGPARFVPDGAALRRMASGVRGRLAGRLDLGGDYNEAGNVRADAPLYVVSGAGGHELKDQPARCPPDLTPPPAGCLAHAVADGRTASATVVSVTSDALVFRRLDVDGRPSMTRTLSRP